MPTQVVRQSEPYSKGRNIQVEVKNDEIIFKRFLFSSAIRNKNKIEEKLDLPLSEYKNVLRTKLIEAGFSVEDSIEALPIDQSGFVDYTSKKLKVQRYAYSENYEIIPYIEQYVHREVEREGGGGIGLPYQTGNEVFQIVNGLILFLIKEDQVVRSDAHYWTDVITIPAEDTIHFSFPPSRLDSLVKLTMPGVVNRLE
jgi:hypothetical protein